MSLFGKFAFLREKSDKRRKGTKGKSTLVYNPYKNKLQRTGITTNHVNCTSLQLLFDDGLKAEEKDFFGNNIVVPPTKKETRFMTYNPNGLPYQDVEFLTQMIRRCVDLHVHYCGFSEINLNTSNSSL